MHVCKLVVVTDAVEHSEDPRFAATFVDDGIDFVKKEILIKLAFIGHDLNKGILKDCNCLVVPLGELSELDTVLKLLGQGFGSRARTRHWINPDGVDAVEHDL